MALAQSAAPPHCCPRSGGGGCCTHGRLCSSHRRRLQMLVLSHQPLGRRDASTRQHVACAARAPAAGGAGSGSASAATSAVGSAGLVALDLVSDVITGTAHVTSSGIRKALTAYQDATRFDPPEDKLPKRWAEQVDRGEGLTLMRHYDTVKQINALEAGMRSLDDAQLQAKTVEFKARLTDGAALDDLLPEAFAAVREASRRVLGLRHFDVQLVGGMALHEGRVAEMKTGEGKTLVATLPAYLRALTGRGVHVVTVNDYLARRDASWIGKVFTWLGVSVGAVSGDSPHSAQITAFAADITYVTGQELCFTYLRDNSSSTLGPEHLVLRRPLYFAIIDEVDSILIDECRNPLLISAPDPGVPKKRFPVAAKVAVQLRPGRGSDLNAVYAAAVALAQIPTQRRAHGLQQDMAIHGGWRDGGEAVCRAKAELLLPPNILKQLLDLKPYSVTNWEVAEELGYTWQVRGKGLVRESGDYSVDLRMRTVELTAYGAQRVAQLLRECLLRTRAASSS